MANASSYVISGSGDHTVRKINPSGNEVWRFTGHTDVVEAVASDLDGNVYSASHDKTVRKIDASGEEVWSFNGHTDNVRSVAVDHNGYVYSGSQDATLRKIDADGNEVWSFTGHTHIIYCIALDQAGNIYSGSSDGTFKKIDPEGNEVWTFFEGGIVYDVAIGSDDHLYIGSSRQFLRKIDPDGNQVWMSVMWPSPILGVVVDEDGYIYFSTSFPDNKIRKVDLNNYIEWIFYGHTQAVWDLQLDSEGNLYSASADQTVRKIRSNGDEIWRFEGHTGTVISIALTLSGEGDRYEGDFDFASAFKVRRSSRSTLDASFTVARGNLSNLPASLIVRRSGISDLPASFHVEIVNFDGLIFKDEAGNGIDFLLFGNLQRGEISETKPFILANRTGVTVTNVNLDIYSQLDPDRVEISKTKEPFVPETLPLHIEGKHPHESDIGKFYARVIVDEASFSGQHIVWVDAQAERA